MAGTKRETLVVERIPFQFRLDPSRSEFESGKFSGIASVFGSLVDTTWRYGVRSRIRQGAFTKSINDRSNRVKILGNHNQEQVWIGLPTRLQETGEGLEVDVSLNNSSVGRDFAEAIRHAAALGKLEAVEMSIGFDAINCDMVEDEQDKEQIREVTEARLWEISVVPFGADRQTRVYEAAALAMDEQLLPRDNPEAVVRWSIRYFRSMREGAAPALLPEGLRQQLLEELALHVEAESPSQALTEYEAYRQLSEIELAEAEMAFAALNN